MASTGPNLRVRISADLADVKQGLGLLRGELAKVKKQANQAAPDASKWSAGLAVIRRQLVGIASIYTAMRAAGSFVRLADEAANLSGRLRLATKSQQEFARAQEQTFRIAQDTSAEWGSIVNLYAQLAQTTGMGQERILALTKTVSQAFTVSGASTQEMANGLRQLQQAMAGGVLRAEEFNTIIETSPRIVQALADHFGISFGQVRKYVNEGKVSSEEFAEALLAASADIQEDFEQLPLTVGRATQQVRNALLKLVGDTDQASGASADLAEAIAGLARVLESDDTKRGFGEIINGLATIITAATAAANAVGKISTKLDELTGASLPEWVKVLMLGATGNYAGAGAALARARAPAPAARPQTGAVGGGDPSAASGVVEETSKAIGGLADASALARDAIARQMAALEQALSEGEVGLVEFYARKKELQLADIDLQIRAAQAEAAAAKNADQRSKALTELAKLQRDREGIGASIARELQESQEDLAKQVGDVYQRILEAQGETGRARIAELEAEFQGLIVKLQAEGDEAGVAIVRKLINIEAARAQLDEFEQQMQQVLGSLGAREGSVSAQQQAGMLGMIEGERQLQDLRTRSLEQLIELRQRAVEFLRTLSADSPEAARVQDFLSQLDGNIATVASSLDKYRQQVADAAVNSLSNFFMDLVERSKSAGDALKDFVRGFALAMAQIAARALATYLVLQLLDAIYPGLGKATAAGMSAGVNHGGGIAGEGGRRRWSLSPLLFGAAPRYHGGGIAGLAPDEVPAILQRGEEVLTRTDPRHRENGGAQGDGVLVKQPIVAIGDRAVADALAGAAGEDVIVTHVRNNWEALSRGG